jgi:hypothetical protein
VGLHEDRRAAKNIIGTINTFDNLLIYSRLKIKSANMSVTQIYQ